MATELNGLVSVTYNQDGVSFSESMIDAAADLTGHCMSRGVMSVGFAAAEAIPLGDVTSPGGTVILKNLDATNYIQIGFDSSGFVPITKILPGQCEKIHPVNAMQAKANVAACLLQYTIIDA